MTSPQYVNKLSDIYTEMYNPSVKEKPLTEDHNKDHDYDIPRWARILNKHKEQEKYKRGPYTAHREEPVKVDEDAEESSTAELAMKYVLELIGEAEHNKAAANALYMIRDLVK
tara:strand:+ start:1726 stop:2064 length:339 start_codon:yes stop_codon:yes gene_type:complete